ncbi:MAG: hypothetical protein LBR85_09740 [Oscillospiraceae bacterium]|nr:hypothetical protein [Oscillospiraceae bacterium]
MKTRKIICLILALTAICTLAGCAGQKAPETKLTGTADAVLTALLEDVNAKISSPVMALPVPDITAENSLYGIGLTGDDFTNYVTSVSASKGALNTNAHEVIVLECKDAKAASSAKAILVEPPVNEGDDGYNPKKWICVMPDEGFAVESGNYLLIVVSNKEFCEAAKTAFQTEAGTIGDINVFWEGAE